LFIKTGAKTGMDKEDRGLIFDVHYHFMSLPSDDIAAREMMEGLITDAKRTGFSRDMDEVLPLYRDYMDDGDCNKLVARMDNSGIDITAIVVVDDINFGFDDEKIMGFNESCARAAAAHPGRLIALAGIDPRRPAAPALFRRCVEEFGMKGLKWHPDFGFYPNSKEAYAVLEIASELRTPLLTHCSPLPSTRAKFSHPIHLDDVAFDFPDLNIIAAHMGHGWWHDWAALAQYKKNIYGDLAMWQLLAVSNPGRFRRCLRELLDTAGYEQVLFASDGPCFEPHMANHDWVQTIKALPKDSSDGIRFTDKEVGAILGGNATRVFGL
jgi:hypothetical protein